MCKDRAISVDDEIIGYAPPLREAIVGMHLTISEYPKRGLVLYSLFFSEKAYKKLPLRQKVFLWIMSLTGLTKVTIY